ncbi:MULTISPECIES: hypothetical protein [unclassified Nocardioides]|uniref:hypothetical protein n=1 Tax=unclassified Nocardioides TaxID=2615069 RepID=UPI00301486C4
MTDQDQLVAQHRDLVAAQVRRVLARVPSHVDRHALHATAEAALATAAGTFCPRPGTPFAAHASATIGLALRELLRSLPAVPPSPAPELFGRLRILVDSTLRSGPSPRRRVAPRRHGRVVRRTTTARFEYPARGR